MDLKNIELKNSVNSWIEAILDAVFPSSCRICGNKLDINRKACICLSCWNKIRIITQPACVSCGKQLKLQHELFCGDCSRNKMSFLDNRSAAVYDDVMREAIHLFKYGDKRKLGKHFGDLLVEYLRQNGALDGINAIIPVPLYKNKRRDYNQSRILAEYLGEEFNLPVYNDVLLRVSDTRAQHGLKKEERIMNVQGAFSVRNAGRIKQAIVLLVDDIFTTGATADECTRTLLAAEANSVRVVTLARGE
ncbi:MAG: ComF family protein [Candidatus Firestonebacteria bacterium]